MRPTGRHLLIACAPVVLVVVYLLAQAAIRERIEAADQRLEASRSALVVQTGGGSRQNSGAKESVVELLAAFGEYAHLSINVAGRVLPIALGAGFGVWGALMLRAWSKRRQPQSVRPPPTARIRRFAVLHLAGIALWALGVGGVALIGARLNTSWYRPGSTLDAGIAESFEGIPWTEALQVAVPVSLAILSLLSGAHLLCAGGPTRPFMRLSRARSVPLAVAVLGAACVLFSRVSVEMYLDRAAGIRALVPDPLKPGYFDVAIGSANATRLGMPVGIALMVGGTIASVTLPRILRRRCSALVGATECIDCAHPLVGAQSVCPECGSAQLR